MCEFFIWCAPDRNLWSLLCAPIAHQIASRSEVWV